MTDKSDGYSTDGSKRGRDSEDKVGGDAIFKRSKRTFRSPDKEEFKERENGDMKEMKEMMKTMMKGIQDLKTGQENYEMEIGKLRKENSELKIQVETLNSRMDQLEKDKIRNNVVISGLVLNAEDKNILKQDINQFIDEKLGIQVKIKAVRKIGEDKGIIEMETFEEKMDLLKNKSKLKKFNEGRVYLDSEMTKNDRIIQAQIRKQAREIRESGKEVTVAYKKAFIDGRVWKWKSDEQKLVLCDTPQATISRTKNYNGPKH